MTCKLGCSISTSGATERASILSNDTSELEIKLLERDIPITISVSRDIAARAATAGLSIKAGDKIRVPVSENADKVDNLFRRLHALEHDETQASSRKQQRSTKPCASNKRFWGGQHY